MGNFMPAIAPQARGQEDVKELLLLHFLLPPNQAALPAQPGLTSLPHRCSAPAREQDLQSSLFVSALLTHTKAHLEGGLEKPSLAEHHTNDCRGMENCRSGWSCRN